LLVMALQEGIASTLSELGSAVFAGISLLVDIVSGALSFSGSLAVSGIRFLARLVGGVLDSSSALLYSAGRVVATDPLVQAVVVVLVALVELGIIYGSFRSVGGSRVEGGGKSGGGVSLGGVGRFFDFLPGFPAVGSRMALFVSLYLPLLLLAEVSVLLGGVTTGLLVHFAVISISIAAGALMGEEGSVRLVFYAFPLIPIIRVANLTLPLDLFTPVLQVVVINGVVLVGIVTAVRGEPGLLSGLGYVPRRSEVVEWVIGLGLALPLGFLASSLVTHDSLGVSGDALSLLRLFLVFVFFVSLTEEVLMRGILQRFLAEDFGVFPAIGVASLAGGIMVVPWGSALYFVFSLLLGLFLGLLFFRTRSIVLVILSHGLVEFGVFGLPLLL